MSQAQEAESFAVPSSRMLLAQRGLQRWHVNSLDFGQLDCKTLRWARDVAQLVKRLPSLPKTLGLGPRTVQTGPGGVCLFC